MRPLRDGFQFAEAFLLLHVVQLVEDRPETRQVGRRPPRLPLGLGQAVQARQETFRGETQVVAVHAPHAGGLREERFPAFRRQFYQGIDLFDLPFEQMPVDHRFFLELHQDASGRQAVVKRAVSQFGFLSGPGKPAGAVPGIFAVRAGREQKRHHLQVDALHAGRPAQQPRDRFDVPREIPEDVFDFAARDF